MASLGHVVVGLAAGRFLSRRSEAVGVVPAMLVFSFLALAPDADVVAFRLGIPYGAPFGHRGASHSLACALVLAVAFTLAMRRHGWPLLRTFAVAVVVAASHGLLDAMTSGGLGIALGWPFTDERFFLPFRLIPVAPIGAGMWSPRGALVVTWEFVLFLPWLAYALGFAGGAKPRLAPPRAADEP